MFVARRILSSPIKDALARAKHTLPDLPYDYKALEPVICAEIMHTHHTKHHATYVNNLNTLEDKLKDAVAKGDVTAQIELGSGIKFNGGGHLNHSIFWCNLTPDSTKPDDALLKQIDKDFSSMEAMKKRLSASVLGIQGSGWAWLGWCPTAKGLRISTCANQDPLEATTSIIPLFGIDIWEHAYYLQYKNQKADYVKAIFDIVNWKDVSARYKTAIAR